MRIFTLHDFRERFHSQILFIFFNIKSSLGGFFPASFSYLFFPRCIFSQPVFFPLGNITAIFFPSRSSPLLFFPAGFQTRRQHFKKGMLCNCEDLTLFLRKACYFFSSIDIELFPVWPLVYQVRLKQFKHFHM